jgi:hypothetical protein
MDMKRWILALAILASVLVAPVPAHACSCAGSSDSEALEENGIAFVGELVDARGPLFHLRGDKTIRYLFEVQTVLKGEVTERVIMSNLIDEGNSCSDELSKGRYVVYGDDLEKLTYHACSPTHAVRASENFEGSDPLPGGPQLPPDPTKALAVVALAAGALALLLRKKLRDPLKH